MNKFEGLEILTFTVEHFKKELLLKLLNIIMELVIGLEIAWKIFGKFLEILGKIVAH